MEANLSKKIVSIGQNVLSAESEAIQSLISTIGEDFVEAVETILSQKGKVVVTGIGKSAIIAQKIVATLNSTGQMAVFLHAADALHGDLGVLSSQDTVICLSKSGDTPEIKALVPLLKRHSNKLIAMVSNSNSFLASGADIVLYLPMEKEACPLNLAPTTSTTLSLAMGDALAMALLEAKNFSEGDFAKYHPGGSLGKKLYLKVKDIYPNNTNPYVDTQASIKDVIIEISSKRLGITAVLNSDKELVGVITDGDLRRMLNTHDEFKNLKAKDIMTLNPKNISSEAFAVEALRYMESHNITQLVVLEDKNVLGFVHLHDLLKEGIV